MAAADTDTAGCCRARAHGCCGHYRYYPFEMTYDYACSLTKGNFIPPGFHPVSSCNFYGFLKCVRTRVVG